MHHVAPPREARRICTRSERGLAALLGAGHGMVAKAGVKSTKPLGEGMAAAFSKLALPGGDERATL
jgi:hypothetical protein